MNIQLLSIDIAESEREAVGGPGTQQAKWALRVVAAVMATGRGAGRDGSGFFSAGSVAYLSAHHEAVVGRQVPQAEVARGGGREHDEGGREAHMLAPDPKHVEVRGGEERARRGHDAEKQCALHEQRHNQRVLRHRST